MESLFNEIEFTEYHLSYLSYEERPRGFGGTSRKSKTNRYCPYALWEGKERKRMAIRTRMMVLLVSYIINTKFLMLKVSEPMRMH